MQEILTKIDNIQNFSEQDISAELEKLIPKDKTEISTELKAELLAFEFIENPYTENSEWGTYFRPMMVWRNDDGTTTESPSIRLVDKVIMDYWYKRIFETNNSLMKARYSGLIWDFSKPILNVNPAYKIGIIYIESLIETVDYDIEN